jgi:preprotein translocase subunit SecB
LQLEGYLVTELSFKAQPDFEYDIENPLTTVMPSDLTVEVALAEHQDDRLRRNCDLTVELADPTGSKVPYVFRTSFTGFFRISDKYPANQVDLMFATNAPALLYSAAREMLATVTGRGPYPAVTLPSVTFIPSSPDVPQPKTNSARKASTKTEPSAATPVKASAKEEGLK